MNVILFEGILKNRKINANEEKIGWPERSQLTKLEFVDIVIIIYSNILFKK